MPGRKYPIVTNEVYHVYNRGINKQPTFTSKREYKRALKAISFYQYTSPPTKLSKFLLMKEEDQNDILKNLHNNKLVKIYSYTLMPNHFHFLVTQTSENGISKFMANFQNSYTRYFNTKKDKEGPLFQDQFKAKRIEDDNILLHIHRYIHLNPYTSYLVKDFNGLINYPWSSFKIYLNILKNDICDINFILSFFKTSDKYKEFILNQADFQKKLKIIKHLTFE